MFAAWEVGVWKALEPRFRPDMIVGTSAGSLIGWVIAAGGTAADLEREWMDSKTAAIMTPGLHWTGCIRPENLYAKAREMCGRYQPRIPFALTLVEVPVLRLRLVRDREITWRHLAASCSIPLGFPPVEIDGRRYVDGGLLGALPLWAAQEMGADRAIALNCLTGLPFRALRAVTRVRRPAVSLEVALIEPPRPLGSLRDAIFWKADNIRRWIAQGVEDGTNALTSVRM